MIIQTVKELLTSQYQASLCTLKSCIEVCPDSSWDASIANLTFCQVAFHVLFYTDLYLDTGESSFRRQQFHVENSAFFRDYEELEDRQPVQQYDQSSILNYLQHCRTKASQVIAAATAESLCERSDFQRWAFSRAELHICSIRHIQHHAAQLGLRLRLDVHQNLEWIASAASCSEQDLS